MRINPILKDQRLITNRYHRKRNTLRTWWRRKTEITDQELIINIGKDFLFDETQT